MTHLNLASTTRFRPEPALIFAAIGAVLSVLVAAKLPGITAEQSALIVTAINAVYGIVVALRTRPVAPAAFSAAIAALAALTAGYGFNVDPGLVGAINGAVLAVLAMLTRPQVTAVGDGSVV